MQLASLGGGCSGAARVTGWLGAMEEEEEATGGGSEIGKACGDRCDCGTDISRCPGTEQSHPPVGRDSPGRRAKRCQMWRKPPGSFTPLRLTLSRLCCGICFQSRVKNAGTSTCQESFKQSPAVSLQPHTHTDQSGADMSPHSKSRLVELRRAQRDPVQTPNTPIQTLRQRSPFRGGSSWTKGRS